MASLDDIGGTPGGGTVRQFLEVAHNDDGTLRDGGSLPINVMTHGAKGDGSTDDTTAIQSAINAARDAGGGTVFFPVGVYIISASLKLYSSVHLWGIHGNLHDTTKAAVIQTAANGTLPSAPMVDANDTVHAGIHALAFACPGTDPTANTTQGITDFSDSSKQATYLTIEDCSFAYFGGTIVGLYGNVNTIRFNSAKTFNGRYIHLVDSGGGPGNGSDNWVLYNDGGPLGTLSSAANCSTGDGIRLDQGQNNTVIGNEVYGCNVGCNIVASSYNRIEGNRFEKHITDGITLDSSSKGNTILGNHCFNNGWTSSKCGINVNGGSENHIVGNYLFNNTSTGGGTNQLYGVLIQSNALANQVVGNHIFDLTNYGIDIRSSTVNLIAENFISTCGQHGIHMTTSANSNTIRGNTIYKCGQTTDNTYDGIRIESNSDSNFITGNSLARSGINQQKYGINISSSDCDTNIVFANNCSSGGETAGINNAGTNTQFNSNRRSTGTMAGRAVLAAGTVTIPTAEVLSGDNVILSRVVAGGTLGNLSIGTISAGTSFVINSDNAADTSTVYWKIDH